MLIPNFEDYLVRHVHHKKVKHLVPLGVARFDRVLPSLQLDAIVVKSHVGIIGGV